MQPRLRSTARTLAVGLAAALAPLGAGAEEAAKTALEPAMQEQLASDEAVIAAQKRIEELSDETREMLLQYRQYLNETRNLEDYARQLSTQVASQRTEIELVKEQLVEIERTAQSVLPLMERMLDTLDRFVALDVPFLTEERRKRVASLRDAMGRADVTISEKYRRILEAYQIEGDYGRTLEAYQGELGEPGATRTVRFLRVGRVALLYQTLDGEETGYWDSTGKRWVRDDSYRSAARTGFEIADKSRAPDLFEAPIPAPTEARS